MTNDDAYDGMDSKLCLLPNATGAFVDDVNTRKSIDNESLGHEQSPVNGFGTRHALTRPDLEPLPSSIWYAPANSDGCDDGDVACINAGDAGKVALASAIQNDNDECHMGAEHGVMTRNKVASSLTRRSYLYRQTATYPHSAARQARKKRKSRMAWYG
jgi:hypothetical protein